FRTGENLKDRWTLHTVGPLDGSCESLAIHLKPIGAALRRLQGMIRLLAPCNSRFRRVQASLDAEGVPSDWRHRYGVYKLRQNVLAFYFDLLARVICARADQEQRFANQLEY